MLRTQSSHSPLVRAARRSARSSPSTSDPLRSLLADAVPYRAQLVLASVLMAGQSGVTLTIPWLAGQLAADILGAGESAFAGRGAIFACMILAFGVQALIGVGNTFLLARIGEQLIADLRVRIHGHLQSLPMAYLQDRRRGDLLGLLTRDVDVISGYLTGTLVSVAPMVCTFLGAWVLMLLIHWQLACLVAALMPAYFALVRLLGRRVRPLSREIADAHGRALAVAEESLALHPVIKAFTREKESSRRFRRESRRLLSLTRRLHLTLGALHPVMGFLAAAGVILVTWLASTALPPADLVAFLMYGVLMVRPLGGLAGVWGDTQHARASWERLNEVLQAEPEQAGGRTLPRVKGDVSFRGVDFAYGKGERVLAGLDLEVSAGETIAITGANGAGKSTIVSLLLAFRTPDAGEIRIDGHDISSVSPRSLRARIGVVPQTIQLLNGTVRENIAFGIRAPDEDRVEAAARAVGAWAFIRGLSRGLDTPIGERGTRLSGGQQQRIALARALYLDPPILVLDEATAMLDPAGMAAFREVAGRAFAGRTVILITHQAECLAIADRVLSIEGGRAVPASIETR